MKRLVVVAALAASMASLVAAGPATFDGSLARDRLWDDGRAEYSVYDALGRRNGVLIPARVTHLVFRERFDAPVSASANAPASTGLLRMDQAIDIPTGVAARHRVISSVWDRTSGDLLKIAVSGDEATCGAFKLGWIDGSNLRLTYRACPGRGADSVTERRLSGGTVFYDELAWKLRTLARPEIPGSYTIDLMPSLVGSEARHRESEMATIVVAPPTKDKLRIDVVRGGAADRFVFDRGFPHVLRLWLRPDGSRLTLRKTGRIDARNLNDRGEEKSLE